MWWKLVSSVNAQEKQTVIRQPPEPGSVMLWCYVRGIESTTVINIEYKNKAMQMCRRICAIFLNRQHIESCTL